MQPASGPPSDRPRRILIVDDDPGRRELFSKVLGHEGYKVDTMTDGAGLVARVRENPPDLVLLDIMLPEVSGLEICGDLRMLDEARTMPIILVTSAFLDEASVVRGLLAGADDYIVSPFRLAELRARIRVQLRNRRDRELLQWARAQGASLKSAAMTDALTGLANRRAADEVLERALENGERVLAVVIDIDHFKQINDTCGHAAGDAAIVEVASAIKSRTRRGDLAARYGGDEFLVVVQGAALDVAGRIGERYLDAIRKIVLPPPPGAARPEASAALPARSLTVSIGIAGTAGGSMASRTALLAGADRALYEAKRAGRDGVSVQPEPVEKGQEPS
jgi:two-component system cell cycle response regulator